MVGLADQRDDRLCENVLQINGAHHLGLVEKEYGQEDPAVNPYCKAAFAQLMLKQTLERSELQRNVDIDSSGRERSPRWSSPKGRVVY